MKWRGSDGEGARRRGGRRVRTEKGTPRLCRRGAEQRKREIWGRGGDRPDAGEKSGKNAALDRPAPSCGIRKNDRDLVSRGTEQGAKDGQEGFRVYESEVGRLLVGAYLRCRDRRTRGFVGCGGRPKRGRRRQRKLARRQKKLARRQRKLARSSEGLFGSSSSGNPHGIPCIPSLGLPLKPLDDQRLKGFPLSHGGIGE